MNKYSAKLNKVIIKVVSFILILVFVLGSSLSVFGDDTTRRYVGNCYYDPDEKMYVYNSPSGFDIYSSVISGMCTTEPVSFSADSLINCKLYKDGVGLDSDLTKIEEPGSYVLDYSVGAQRFESIKFTILNDVTGKIDAYSMPQGFYVIDVIFNGKRIAFAPDRVDFSEEGKYEITYYCRTLALQYHLDVEIDHTAPVLELTGITDGVARGPVVVSEIEEDVDVYLEKDGRKIALPKDGQLPDSGDYYISITDKAGNTSSQRFKIVFYLNIDSKVFIIISAAAILALLISLLIKRKRFKVR